MFKKMFGAIRRLRVAVIALCLLVVGREVYLLHQSHHPEVMVIHAQDPRIGDSKSPVLPSSVHVVYKMITIPPGKKSHMNNTAAGTGVRSSVLASSVKRFASPTWKDEALPDKVHNPYNFPSAAECGKMSVWEDYTSLHHKIVTGQVKGKYLRYNCVSQFSCGGWGNRLGGISVALTLAVITKRAFLVRMPLPVDINILMQPNAITWNHRTEHLPLESFFLVDPQALDENWPAFYKMLMNYDSSVDVMDFRTNLGFYWFMPKFSKQLKQMFNESFPVDSSYDYRILYGCIQRYLFKYNQLVLDAIQKEMADLHLQAGHYVAAHYRTQLIAADTQPPTPLALEPHLRCVAIAVESLNRKHHSDFMPAYLLTDTNVVDDMAHKLYDDKIRTSPVEKIHIDRTKLKPRAALSGYVGVLVNIEVAAKAAVFLRFGRQHSSMADLIESLGRNITTVIQCGPNGRNCLNDTSVCSHI